MKFVPLEMLKVTSIEEASNNKVMTIYDVNGWITPIYQFLKDGILPTNSLDAKRIRYTSARYLIYDDIIYKRGFSTPLLRCLDAYEAAQFLTEIHEGTCGNHAGSQSLALKVIRQGYYWPSIRRDAIEYVKSVISANCLLSFLELHLKE